MAQYDETEAYWVGENRQMIAYKGELYSSLLPRECVFEPIEGTGPIDCKTCKQVGFWNGCFVMFCNKCCKEVFKYKYGYGAISKGIEMNPECSNSYLKDVTDWDTIGDIDLEDSKTMIKPTWFYDRMPEEKKEEKKEWSEEEEEIFQNWLKTDCKMSNDLFDLNDEF